MRVTNWLARVLMIERDVVHAQDLLQEDRGRIEAAVAAAEAAAYLKYANLQQRRRRRAFSSRNFGRVKDAAAMI